MDSANHYESPLRLAQPGQHICRVTGQTLVQLEVQVVRCSQKQWEEDPACVRYRDELRCGDWLVLPPIFSPVLKVNYNVIPSEAGSGQETVQLEVWSRASTRPVLLVKHALTSL